MTAALPMHMRIKYDGKDILIATNREIDEVARYELEME